MAITIPENLKYITINYPNKGYIFDKERMCFAKLPPEIKDLESYLFFLLRFNNPYKAKQWFDELDWKAEKELLSFRQRI